MTTSFFHICARCKRKKRPERFGYFKRNGQHARHIACIQCRVPKAPQVDLSTQDHAEQQRILTHIAHLKADRAKKSQIDQESQL